MRNLKKFLALVLAMLMVVSASAVVSAYDDVAEDSQYAAAIDALTEYGIVNGVAEGQFGPAQDVKRFQMALMVARALKPAESNWADGMKIFDDVTEWYGAIAFAYMNNIVTGIGNNQFAPMNGIRYQDALIMALRALGYTVDVSGNPYWLAAYNKAAEIGLTDNVAVFDGGKTLTREETAQVIYNMLKATPADGGATLEAKNFGVATVDNTTTFVITATGKQAYTGASEKLVDAAYVTLQLLNADGTLGDAMYVEFDKLGFDADVKADDVIGYTVGLVNLKNGEFDTAVPGTATVVANTDVKVDGVKVTIDGRTYYLVEEYAENTIKNELIVKDASGIIYDNILNAVKDLYFNKKGNVVNADGKELAVKSDVTSANGETLYILAEDVDKDAFLLYTAEELVKLEKIANEYNKSTVASGYSDVEELTGAFTLTLFDDDNDGKYDRGIKNPVYMSVYSAKSSDKETVTGPMNGLKDVVYTETLAKGDIFVYTYNKQTKVVDVLDVLELEYGVIEKINFNKDEKKDYTVTISDTAYKFGGLNSEAVVGAKLYERNTGKLNNTDTIGKIVSEPALAFVNWNTFIENASIGATVKYYAYNDVIIYAESYDVEESFQYITIKEVTDYDSESVVADIYVDGKLVKDAVLSEVFYKGDTVDLDEVKNATALKAINEYYMGEHDGCIFKGIVLADGTYRLGVEFDEDNATKSVKNDGFGLVEYDVETKEIEFSDGVALMGTDRKNAIRTSASTVFYFISTDADGYQDVRIVITSGKDYVIETTSDTVVFADKVGYSGSNKGVATKVFVFNYDEIEGFGFSATVKGYVYVPSGVNKDRYEVDSASGFGLGSDYSGTYYKYSGVGVNLASGDKISLYSSKLLTPGYVYSIDENGVVVKNSGASLASSDAVDFSIISASDIDLNDDEYRIINGVISADDDVQTIKFNKASGTVDVKTNSDAKALLSGEDAYKVYYLVDDEGYAADLKDGVFVAIVGEKYVEVVEPETKSFDVKVVGLVEGVTATVATVPAEAELVFNADGTQTFEDLDADTTYTISVTLSDAGYTAVADWDEATRTYNVTVKAAA